MKKISVLVRNEEQLQSVLKYNIDNIYTDNLSLALKYPKLYYQVPIIYNEKQDLQPSNLLVNDIGLLDLPGKNIITDYLLNVFNSQTINYLKEYKVQKIALSIELSLYDLKAICEFANCELIIYGAIEVMNLKKHPIFTKSDYILKSKTDTYHIKVDDEKHVHIFDLNVLNRIDLVDEYEKLGITNFRLDFFRETPKEIATILDNLYN